MSIWRTDSAASALLSHTTRRALVSVSILTLWLAATPTEAGDLTVTAAAAHSGPYGLRIDLAGSCSSPYDVAVDGQTLSGTSVHEACAHLESSTTTVASGSATFRAGRRIALGDGFSVASGASFTAEIDSTLLPDAYVWDETPAGETHYAAGFYLDPDNLTMAGGDAFKLLSGRSSNGLEWFSLSLGRHALINEKRLVLEARRDDGTIATTEGTTEILLPAGWHWIFVEWKATTAGSYGYVRLYVDDLYQAGMGPLYNDTGTIDRVEMGAQGVDAGTSGTFNVDEFISRLAGVIESPP